MRVRVLGPLEMIGRAGPVCLGGTRQRATLGFLSLHANRTVATSDLLDALWPSGEVPVTARKVLQNAVRGLRAVFASASGNPSLLTRSPGYLLSVDPDQVDLFDFRRRAAEGRDQLAAGRPAEAAETLRVALALWRGAALADLVEAGITWPALTAVQNERLDALEDYLEAELASGRHRVALGELEALVETEPVRERLCYQLMLALYRSGRQADALHVYRRVRSRLVERLGLEPGRSLQTLQRAILAHDPTLMSLERPARWPGATSTNRRKLSVVMVRALFDPERWGTDPEGIGETLDGIDAVVRTEAGRFGGTVVASSGSVPSVLFGMSGLRDDDTELAVLAALAIRDQLSTAVGGQSPVIRLAVATGQAWIPHWGTGTGTPPVRGAFLEQCQSLLACAPDGEILVCDHTHGSTKSAIGYDRADGPAAGWRVLDTVVEVGRIAG